MKHKPVKAVVFDLDGTLYLSGRPYPGAVDAVKRVAARVPVYYLSNNTSKSPVFYENRLNVMGLPLRDDSIISALYLSLDAIHEKGIKNVYFFANPEVYEWFAAQDPSLNLQPSVEDTELVLVAYHNSFDYRELCELSFRVQRGIPFWMEKIGYGDSWLIGVLGVYLGGTRLLELMLIASFSASLCSIVYCMIRGWNKNHSLPFIPFMMAAFVGVLFL